MSKRKKNSVKKPIKTKKRAREPSPKPRLINQPINPPREKKIGYVYWANSQKIDKYDAKIRRQYAVLKDTGKNIGVSKIRGYDENLKNDERLYELDMKKYPLSKKSGVDKKLYTQKVNRKGEPYLPLRLEDKEIFDPNPSFKMSSHDTHGAILHARGSNKNKPNKGKKG